MTAAIWHARLAAVPLGTRIVLRYRIGDAATDALGDLIVLDTDRCVVRTRRGDVAIALDDVVAGRPVPPPPPRRAAGPGAADAPPE